MEGKDKNKNTTLINKYDLPVKGLKNSAGSQATLNNFLDFVKEAQKPSLLKYLDRREETSKEILENKKDPRIEIVKKIPPLINTARNTINNNRDSGFYIASIEKLCGEANMITLSPVLNMGKKYSKSQSILGKKGAKQRWQNPSKLASENIISSLREREDVLGDRLSAKELWPEFYSELEAAHLNPKETPHSDPRKSRIDWADGCSLTFGAFQNSIKKIQN